jgi:dihydroflavonol-4-reductase
MVRVLVTGASGFIGANLTARLVEQGDDVTCLVRATSNRDVLARLGVRFVVGDVRDPAAVRGAIDGAETVYHLAGLATAFRPVELIEVNTGGFRNVAAACAGRSTPPTLVAVSSLSAAGPSPADRPRVEGDPARPVSHYGRAKRAAEVLAAEMAGRLPITIVRPPIVFGEGDLQLRDAFRSIFRYGVHLALGVARSRYSLVHVKDLVEALVLCAQRGARLERESAPGASNSPRGYYFVAGDEQPTFAELGRLIGAGLGRPRVRVVRTRSRTSLLAAAAVAEAVARLRGKPYIFNFDKAREALAGNWTCSPETIRRELGFAPRATFLERLRQTSDWYLRQKLI